MPLETFPEKVKRAQIQVGAKVHILVWGPGKQTKEPHWYEKRKKVIEHIQGLNPNYDVWTSEDIIEDVGSSGTGDLAKIDAGSTEYLHAISADIIVALVLGHPDKQPGIYRELQLVSHKRELRDKTYIFIPDQQSYRKHFTSGVVNNFRDDHIFALPWVVIKHCEQIRSRCEFLAEQELKQKLLDVMNSIF
ncbi:MAG: hypothetical protein ABSA18_02820 [Dehalococcoidia bacterium]|jgi:hypothetical protein